MTVRALGGLFALNVGYALVGLALLWGGRGFRCWGDVIRLAGLGYLLGVAAFGVVWTALLVAGAPFGEVEVVVSLAALGAASLVAGRLRAADVPTGLPRIGATPVVLAAARVALER